MNPKIHIGSRYEGVSFDRPCIRQMPRHWTLELDAKPRRQIWIPIATTLCLWFGAFMLCLVVIAQTL